MEAPWPRRRSSGVGSREGSNLVTDPADSIRRQDDLLQVLFWLQGEGLGEEVGPDLLSRFVQEGQDELERSLEALRAKGYVKEQDGLYRLTPVGLEEGKRRFLEEFEPVLARGGHGLCADPSCDCHESPDPGETCPSLQDRD